MKYIRYILFGGQVRLDGGSIDLPPVNFKPHALSLLVLALAALLAAPLVFVQSPVGVIPYASPPGFASARPASQYSQAFTYTILSVLESGFDGQFPKGMPQPQGLGWLIFVSAWLLAFNAATVAAFVMGVKRLYDNYQTYAGRLRNVGILQDLSRPGE